MIPFNKPFLSGNELQYIREAVSSGKISGDGFFTKKCHDFFERRFGFKKALLTTSCTDALEMASILMRLSPGDEIIVPSYTFVSTANAFVLRGAKIVFADSEESTPNISVLSIERLITPKTRGIVAVHYAGVACDMNPILEIAKKNNLFVVEDAAQAIDSYYYGKPLGSLGHFSAFSFHETKNVISGEGGLFVTNDAAFAERAEIIREKGTNRSAFFRGEVDKYGWVDIGSSFLPSDLVAAFLYAQLEKIEAIQEKRRRIWSNYFEGLSELAVRGQIRLPSVPAYATNNAHMFYLICRSLDERTRLIQFLKERGVHAVFHYLPLHRSQYFQNEYHGMGLPNAEFYSDCLVRLPLFYELSDQEISRVVEAVHRFYQ